MIETYQVFSYLHNMMRKDDLAIKLCKAFLKQHPLSWVKVGSESCPEYHVVDEQGRDYVRIISSEGNAWKVTEGKFFDAVFPFDTRSESANLSSAFEYAEEILSNVDFLVRTNTFLESQDDGADYHASYYEACLTDKEDTFKPCHDDACHCLDAEEKS